MGCIVTLGMVMAGKRAIATVKYYGGKLGNGLTMFATYGPPYAGNFGAVTRSRGHGSLVTGSRGHGVTGSRDRVLTGGCR